MSTAVFSESEFGPSPFERASYYNGITGDDDHPVLVYRSDFSTKPFTKPTSKLALLPVKSVHGVFDTPLNKVWVAVGLQIVNIIKARKISLTSVNPARFFTHPAEGRKGSLGPVVVWIGVKPGTTSPQTAHDASQEILALLKSNGVEGVVVEWKESLLQRLAGPPLLPAVDSSHATHDVRRFLTPLHGVPLAAQDLDIEGTLTLWFHENLDRDGKPSDRVFGVTNCHVLRKDTTVDYEHKDGAAMSHVRVCGNRRFDRGLSETTGEIANRATAARILKREIANLEEEIVNLKKKEEEEEEEEVEEVEEEETASLKAKEIANWKAAKEIANLKAKETANIVRAIERKQWSRDRETEADTELRAFHADASLNWSQNILHRNIGYTQFAPAITVDVEGGTRFTSDWGVFAAAEGKVKDAFEGNVVYLGTKYTPHQIYKMFYPTGSGGIIFKLTEEGRLRIEGWSTLDELAVPDDIDSEHQRFVMVGKDGNTTDLTVGRYAGLVSFVENDAGVTSIEIGIYNAGRKIAEAFSDKGDSGALVWHVKNGKGYIVGQLHSGENKGGSSSNHVTYCTPGEKLQANIKAKFPHADFFRTAW